MQEQPLNAGRPGRRTFIAATLLALVIPGTILFGVFCLGDRKYYFISLLIMLYSMLPFALVFERRRPEARELLVVAVLAAIAVAGRAAFFMLPQFKPVVAIVIITGVCCGAEAGFLVGAVAGFVSNFFFGQGPWAPWQMFSLGVIGFLAGILIKRGFLKKERLPLCLYGGFSAFFIYGGIIDCGSLLMFTPYFSWPALLTVYVSGFWFNVVHAAATVFFPVCFIPSPDRKA